MDTFAQAIISGLVFGAIYAIMTMGLTLVYGCLRTLNMAQGAFGMVGGYAAWVITTDMGAPPIVGLVVGALAAAGVGMLTHFISIKPLVGRKDIDFEMTAYISTLVVAIVFSAAIILLFGARNKAIEPLIDGRLTVFGTVTVAWQQIAVAVVALLCLGGLSLMLSKTRQGLSIMAVAQQFDAAKLMGVPAGRVYWVTMALAGLLGGIAGVLLAPLYFVSPSAGDLPILKGLTVAVVAGLGSIRGTIYAAFIIGLIETLVATYVGSLWSLPVLFAIIVVFMVVRPYGLFGKPEEERL
jgi:branched-subunit amino acid ABC-type transport system permease component